MPLRGILAPHTLVQWFVTGAVSRRT